MLVRLANGNVVDDSTLPRRNGVPYDPTAVSGGGTGIVDQGTDTYDYAKAADAAGGTNFNRGVTANKVPLQKTLPTALSGTTPSDKANKTWATLGVNTTAIPTDIPPSQAGSLRLLSPTGQWKFSTNPNEIHDLLKQGYRSIRDNGDVQEVRPLAGGFVIDYGGGNFIPLDTAMNGRMTSAQLQALQQGGYSTDPSKLGITVIPDNGAGNTGTPNGPPVSGANAAGTLGANGYFGNQGAAAPGLAPDSDLQYLLRQLIDEARNQGKQGQEAYKGVFEDLKDYLGFARAGAEQSMATRDKYMSDLFGQVTPGIQSAMDNMNTATGLSPEAMQALRLQATEQPQRDYQAQVEQLKSQLASRGAYGGGDTPGSLGDIVRGYGPLMGNRDATRANLLAQTTLADEQRKFDTLGLNRQTALGAMGTASSLAGTVGSAYNPASLLGANTDAINGILSGINGMNNSGMSGTSLAGQLAGQWGESQPGSFKNTLLAALASTGVKAAANTDWIGLIKKGYDAYQKAKASGTETVGNPFDPNSFGQDFETWSKGVKNWANQQV